MATLLRVDTSVRTEGSTSRAVADTAEQAWTQANPEGTVVRRDLGVAPLPVEAWPLAMGAGYTSEDARTEEQREAVALSAAVGGELIAADALILASPLYNFGVNQYTKAWIDLLITHPQLGPGSEVLRGKPALLVVAQGGGYRAGTPRHGWDHATAYLERILQDNFGMELRTVIADLTLASSTPAMTDLVGIAEQSLATAHTEATRHGTDLSTRLHEAA